MDMQFEVFAQPDVSGPCELIYGGLWICKPTLESLLRLTTASARIVRIIRTSGANCIQQLFQLSPRYVAGG